MVGRVFRSSLGMDPPLIGPGAAVQNILLIRTGQVRVEGHVEGQVDGVSGHGGIGAHAGAGHGAFGVGRDHVCLRVRPGHAKAHRGRDAVPAMPRRPCELGDLVHARRPESCTSRDEVEVVGGVV